MFLNAVNAFICIKIKLSIAIYLNLFLVSMNYSNMANVIFEIFSEEIPATLQKSILTNYNDFIRKELKKLKINAKNDSIVIGITPNRIVLKMIEIDITTQLTTELINKILKDFSGLFPRTMCFPQMSIRWLRPIRNIFACVDNNVIIDDFYGLRSKNGIYVDKFLFKKCESFEKYISILDKAGVEVDYNKRLEFIKNEIYNFYIKSSKNECNKEEFWLFQKTLGSADKNKLAEEIAGMSERCVKPIECILDDRFNVLPFELIELVLRENQRYIVFEILQNNVVSKKVNQNNISKNDNTENKDNSKSKDSSKSKKEIQFLIFGDKNNDNIKRGHWKVINARLDDALFYWQKDEQYNNSTQNNKAILKLKNELSNRIFVDNISWEEYLTRQESVVARVLNTSTFDKAKNKEKNSINNLINEVKELIWKTKLDLSTGVVCEFPELQGIIGEYYFGYQFNPYVINEKQILSFEEDNASILYYYLIDRATYINVMFEQNKQPTSSGDKYKIKARMDDIVILLQHPIICKNLIKVLNLMSSNKEIYKLLIKRYQKYIEDKFANVKNIKQFAEIYTKNLAKLATRSVKSTIDAIVHFQDEKYIEYVKIYKRIHGYTENLQFIENEQIIKRVKEIDKEILKKEEIGSLDTSSINEYLDNHKISEDETTKKALKWIEVKYFEQYLQSEFLEII